MREKTATHVSSNGTANKITGIVKDFQVGSIPGFNLIVATEIIIPKNKAPASPI
jgi:hypothetical protein